MKAVEGGMSANATYALQVMAIDVAKAVGEQSASNQSRHPPSSAPAGEDRRVSDGRDQHTFSAATISPPPTRRAASTARLTRLLLSSDLLCVCGWSVLR